LIGFIGEEGKIINVLGSFCITNSQEVPVILYVKPATDNTIHSDAHTQGGRAVRKGGILGVKTPPWRVKEKKIT